MENRGLLSFTTPLFLNGNMSNQKLCRTCLSEHENTTSLFQDEIDKMLLYCTSIQVNEADGLPSTICTECIKLVKQLYLFKQQVEMADNMLKNYYREVKTEEPICIQVTDENNPLEFDFNQVVTKTEIMDEVKVENCEEEPETFVINDGGQRKSNVVNQMPLEPYKCPQCLKVFCTIKGLNRHKKSSASNESFTCDLCSQEFTAKCLLKKHIRSHRPDEQELECLDCQKKFCSRKSLTRHMHIHTRKRMRTISDIVKTIKIEQPKGDDDLKCGICNEKFNEPLELTLHRKTHANDKKYICSVCGLLCKARTHLIIHTRVHTKERPYQCSYCPKAFASIGGLNAHILTHTGERKHLCSYCGKAATSSSDLKRHLRIHTGERPYQCTIPNCNERFIANNALKKHIRKHTGEKTHKCTVCPKTFGTSTQLKNHMNTHTGMKPYVCIVCGDRFAHSGTLCRHKRIHQKSDITEVIIQS